MKERLRKIVLSLLNHPSSDQPEIAATIERLKASIVTFEELENCYQEEDASMHRKRSMQTSHNMREPAKAFSSFAEDATFVHERMMITSNLATAKDLRIDLTAFALAPKDAWIYWEALPTEVTSDTLSVALEDPRRGIVLSEIERTVGRRVIPDVAGISGAEIVRLIEKAPEP